MYSGVGATQRQELGYLPCEQGFLKPTEWHDRAPFFVRLTKDVDWVKHPPHAGPLWFNHPFDRELLQKSMDQEIRFALGAGIDFFIYHGPATKVVGRGAWGLKNNLDAHIASNIPEASKMKFVWALYGHEAIQYTRAKVARMMDETITYIKMPSWQKVLDGRPLIIVLWPDQFKQQLANSAGEQAMTGPAFTGYLRQRVTAAGLKDPYIVGCTVPARSYQHADVLKEDGYDAFMDYAGGYGGAVARRDEAPSYATATASLIETLERDFLNRGLPFIPSCTSMQYPWPRALDKETGKPAERFYHYQWPKPGDLAARVETVFDFVAAHPKACEAQVVSMYSWNECSEGGGLIPTMGESPEYNPVTRWLDEVAGALAVWTYPQ
jgi:rhodanese-related sulfurtransferase